MPDNDLAKRLDPTLRTQDEQEELLRNCITGLPDKQFWFKESEITDLTIQFGRLNCDTIFGNYGAPHMLQLKVCNPSEIRSFSETILSDTCAPNINKKEFHITICYNRDRKNRMEDEMRIFRQFIQTEIILKATHLVYNSRGAAMSVILPEELKHLKQFPHITISNAKGIPPVYSNTLLEKASEDKDTTVIDISKTAPNIYAIGIFIPFK